MPLQLDDLAALDAPAPEVSGLPLMLAIDAIDEDPDQPRKEFDADALQELADTIRERGVRQPVSVRPKPPQPGHWILNFGARRLRAARLAGLTQIPAFVDTTADHYDQVIENEQREGLRPLELALFVQRRLGLGESQAEIARRMGKSKAYVTYAMALIDAPDWLLAAYREGRCHGLRELYELRKLACERPQFVEAWASDREAITRHQIAALRAEVTQADSALVPVPPMRVPAAAPPSAPSTAAITRPAKAETPGRSVLCARLDGEIVRIDANRPPARAGHVFVRNTAEGSPMSVEASRLVLLGFDAADGRSTV
ncbi:MAG: ParB/RepB/Spo0J family partition protein [Rubrivivax sp.]|nr:ParB/RepB/Spo0J family partition protein [Rubrivivax sp.]